MISINLKSKVGQMLLDGMFNPELLTLKYNFTIVPNQLITNDKISNNARSLLIYLISSDTEFVIYDELLCKYLKCGQRTLRRLFNELQREGYVTNIQLFDEKARVPIEKRVFCSIPVFFDRNLGDQTTVQTTVNLRTSVQDLSTPVQDLSTRSIYNNTLGNIIIKSYTKPKSYTSYEAYFDRTRFVPEVKLINAGPDEDFNDFSKAFDRFWIEYPVKASKKRARDVFIRKVRNYDPREIIVALRAQKAEREQRQKYNLFTPNWPHPTTWLNGERWDDYIMSPEDIKKEYQQTQKVGKKDAIGNMDYKDMFNEARANLLKEANFDREVKDVN